MQEQKKEQIEGQPEVPKDQSAKYFSLMQIAGSNGRYQTLSLIIWSTMWLVTGALLLGTPFFFYNPPYDCSAQPDHNIDEQTCQKYVCSLPPQRRDTFRSQDIKTIANEFQNFHCNGQEWKLDLLSSLIYFGSFFGYVIVSFLADNLGRKKSILISYGISLIGMLLIGLSVNLVMIGMGFFMVGFGSDTAITICFNFITEAVEDKKRQKHSVIIQFFFSLGGVINIPYFFFIRNWRIIFWIFFFVPSAACLFSIWKFIEDTPFFLVKLKEIDGIYASIRNIMKINGMSEDNHFELSKKQSERQDNKNEIQNQNDQKNENRLSQSQTGKNIIMEQIIMLKNHFELNKVSSENGKKQKILTPIDLFRYSSIRLISIAICIVSFSIYLLYYGPLMLISKFSFSIYVNALAVTMSEIVTYPIMLCIIDKVKRKTFHFTFFLSSVIISTALVFVVGDQCEHNDEESQCQFLKYLQLILIFMFRFCVSFEFAVILIYSNEVFPTQVRGLGLGVSSCVGTIASTCSPYIFGSHIEGNSSTSKVMIVFAAISALCLVLCSRFLPETLGKPIKDELEESISNKKQKDHIQLVQTY